MLLCGDNLIDGIVVKGYWGSSVIKLCKSLW